MRTLNNPAGRLVTILRKAKSMKNQSSPAKQVWPEILESKPKDIPVLLKRLGQLLELPYDIRNQILQFDDIDQKIYLKWLPKVQKSFSALNLDGPFKNFIAHIDEAALDGLDFCSDLLSRRSPERILDQEELNNIYSEAEELRVEIFESSIENELKLFLTQKLDEILHAIKEHNIKGAQPIENAVESTIGAIYIKPERFEKTKNTPKGEKFWRFLGRIALVLNITASGFQICESVGNMQSEQPPAEISGEIIEDDPELRQEK